MGRRKVITNLWKGRTVYACVTAADSEKPDSFRLFLCTAASEELLVLPGLHNLLRKRNRKIVQPTLLPYYSRDFQDYRWQSPQEICYQLEEKPHEHNNPQFGANHRNYQKNLPL